MKIKLNKKDTALVHDDKGHVKRVPKSKVPELLKRQGWGLAEAKEIDHQHKIARDTVKNPLKGKFLGGPSAEEAEHTLRTKYGYTDQRIKKLKEEVLNELSPELLKRYLQKTDAKTAKQYNAGDSAGLQRTGRGIGSAAMRLGGFTPKKIAALKLKYLERDHSDWGDTQHNEEVLPGEGEGWHAKKKTNVTSAPKRKPVPGRQVYRPKGPVNTSHLSLAHYEPEGDMIDEGQLKNSLIDHGDGIHNARKRHANLLKKSDQRDLGRLADHIESGNIHKARSHYEKLDTAVKDIVPVHTRKFLYREETEMITEKAAPWVKVSPFKLKIGKTEGDFGPYSICPQCSKDEQRTAKGQTGKHTKYLTKKVEKCDYCSALSHPSVKEESINEGRPYTHHDYLEDAEREAMRADALRTRANDPRHKNRCKHPMKYRVSGECGNCGATKAELQKEEYHHGFLVVGRPKTGQKRHVVLHKTSSLHDAEKAIKKRGHTWGKDHNDIHVRGGGVPPGGNLKHPLTKEEFINEVSILHRAPKKKIKVDVSTLRQRARSLAGKVEKALEDYDEVTQDEIDYAGRQAHPRKIAILKNLTAVKAEERAWLNGLVFALKKGSFDVAARTYRNLSPDVKKILPPEIEQFLGQEGLGGVYEGTEVDLEGLLIEAKRTATARKAIKKVLSSKKDNTPPKKINEIEFNPTVDLGIKPGTAKQPTGFRTEATLTEGAKKAWNPKDALYSFAKRPKSAGKPWGFNPITGKKKKTVKEETISEGDAIGVAQRLAKKHGHGEVAAVGYHGGTLHYQTMNGKAYKTSIKKKGFFSKSKGLHKMGKPGRDHENDE